MQRNTKDWIHYLSASLVLIAAIALVYISYFLSHDVTSNVLWYFGQSLMYVGTVLVSLLHSILESRTLLINT